MISNNMVARIQNQGMKGRRGKWHLDPGSHKINGRSRNFSVCCYVTRDGREIWLHLSSYILRVRSTHVPAQLLCNMSWVLLCLLSMLFCNAIMSYTLKYNQTNTYVFFFYSRMSRM